MSSKSVLVTGASRGIGLAVCRSLLSQGSRVVGVSRSAIEKLPSVQALQTEFPDAFEYISLDLTEPHAAETLVKHAISKVSALDAVVFNAGVLDPISKLSDVDVKGLKHLFDVNVFSILELAQKTLPFLRQAQPGRMIFVSSGAAVKSYPGWGAYCMSKTALNMMAGSFGLEEPDIVSIALRPGSSYIYNFI
ncbi:hypothetical protein HDU97_003569 [Phlyctochytrium planicorne]|nr:hypothetical protein HDU97_003569 [Phlyctochytrium planicorne]